MPDQSQVSNPRVWPAWLTVSGLIVATLAVVSFAFWDREVAEWTAGLPAWIGHLGSRVTQLGRTEVWLIPLAIVYVACVVHRARRGAEWAWLAFWSVAASGLAVDVVKWVVARDRPTLWVKHQPPEYGFVFFRTSYEHTGFPSGHSATIASLCAALWFVWPRWRPVWVLLALAVGASRVFTGSHYPSDVVVGLYVGVATTIVLRALLTGRRPWGYPAAGNGEPGA